MFKNFPLRVGAATISVAVALVALLIVTGTVFAAGNITVSSDTVDNTGDEATIVVSAAAPSGSGIGNWQFEIAYDPAELGTPTCTPLEGGCAVDPGGAIGTIRLAGATGLAAGLTGVVELATVTANAGVAAGECSDLTISSVTSFQDEDVFDIDDPALEAGAICVAAATTSPPTAGVERKWGDSDCDSGVGTRDSQALLRFVLQQSALSQTPPCLDIGEAITVVGHDGGKWADWDCDGTVGTRDSQAILRFVLQQPALSQTGDCPGIGDLVHVSD